jgi:glyoxylase I family protein
MSMPTFSKVSHISFSVTDAEASARWWANLLDLTELDRVGGDGWRAILLIHPPSRTIVEFQQHDANQGEAFDPRRTGFDHMGFKVDTRADLTRADAVRAAGVAHSPIAEREYGAVLTLGTRRHSVRDVLQSRPPMTIADEATRHATGVADVGQTGWSIPPGGSYEPKWDGFRSICFRDGDAVGWAAATSGR